MIQLFTSKEWKEEEEKEFESNILKYGSMFLDETSKVNKVAFASYVRSGNSLTRKYFEDITGIVTGSNQDNRYVRNFALTLCGFKGEVKYNDSIWVFKTHVPQV